MNQLQKPVYKSAPSIFLVLILLVFLGGKSSAQIIPKDYDTLNYRLVGFSVPENTEANLYQLEVYDYLAQDDGDIETLVVKKSSKSNRFIEVVPEFGRNYRWRVKYIHKMKVVDSTEYHYFSTGYSPVVDTNKFRMKIIKPANVAEDMYIMVDYISVLYDLQGNPLWYLPDITVAKDKAIQMRDVKATHDGTFTAASGMGAYEFDYNANRLWVAPNDGKVSGDTTEYYHHEFTKLSNGHYMICGHKNVYMQLPADKLNEKSMSSKLVEKGDDGNYYIKAKTGTLIEYDSKGNVVWRWLSEDHFSKKYFFRESRFLSGINTDMHLNGFEFDEKNSVIYMSYRNTNQVVKIAYPSGKILGYYGMDIENETSEEGPSPFYGQHCIRKAADGRLYLFNNNTQKFDLGSNVTEPERNTSYVTIFEEGGTEYGGIKVDWEFSCDIDSYALAGAGAGGSVYMLDDKSVLTSMGGASRIFIVSPEKEILWNVIPESSDANGNWQSLGQYRTSYIYKKDIEKYIFK